MRYKKDHKPQAEPDMTPMLDIVFILLIFFIVTTSFVKEESFNVSLPDKNKANTQMSQESMHIKINKNGQINFNGKIVDIERLASRIENFIANQKASAVIVTPSADTNYQQVISVLDKIKPFNTLSIIIGRSH